MKNKKFLLLYILLIVFNIISSVIDGNTELICTYAYFSFIYFNIYICIVVRVTKESFNKLILLRKKSRIQNACLYIKYIIVCTILYSGSFIFSQLIAEIIIQKNEITSELILYFIIQFFVHSIAWLIYGMIYYFVYALVDNKAISVLVAWLCCNLSTSSHSVLFRPGKYIYNAFKYMEVNSLSASSSDKLLNAGKGCIILIILIVGVLIVQKKKNYIKKI